VQIMGTNMGHNLNDFKIETLDIEWGQSVTNIPTQWMSKSDKVDFFE
jgi:hypothetical protein